MCTVPGVVFDLTGQPRFTFILLMWSAPQEPNGVIISYEVTYRVSDGNPVTTNTTDLRFTIPLPTRGTNVTEISVSAYTIVGRVDPVLISYLTSEELPRKLIFQRDKTHTIIMPYCFFSSELPTQLSSRMLKWTLHQLPPCECPGTDLTSLR